MRRAHQLQNPGDRISPSPKRQRIETPEASMPVDRPQPLAGPSQLQPAHPEHHNLASKYPLFWFLPQRFEAHVSRLTDLRCFTETPPQIPPYKEPRLETVPVGIVLNVPDYIDEKTGTTVRVASDAAILHACFAPPFYQIAARSGRLLKHTDYCLDPHFATEKLILIKVKELIQNHMIELTTYRHQFITLLRSWRKKRRLWEVRLALSQVRRGNESIFQHAITHDDLEYLCSWLKEQQAAEDRAEIEACSFGRVTGLVHLSYKEPQRVQGGFVTDASVTRWEKLKTTIGAIVARVNTLQYEEDEQRRRHMAQCTSRVQESQDERNASFPSGDSLLVDFDLHESDSIASIPVIDPIPLDPEHRVGYYHWQVERHGVWAPKGLFRRTTYLGTFQLAPPEDLSFYNKPRSEWPRGHQGLLPELVAHIDDFQVHPWGLVSTRFAQALRQQPRYTTEALYSKKARLVLKSIENWYFANRQMSVGYIQNWPLPPAIRRPLSELIQDLQ
ncbi:hypothetical protein BDV28DRAFT_155379 [Aspergillus coremiiformis]|uniref:Uncharacterized protein n=1 Tax=Aspergillus coremiiformis TaxID=138285 RepID=A0A5N6ZDJ5_9EURO|nr:hypothetical protein BDV28DRAFT_155379 [Aspergillus coremiiformis]